MPKSEHCLLRIETMRGQFFSIMPQPKAFDFQLDNVDILSSGVLREFGRGFGIDVKRRFLPIFILYSAIEVQYYKYTNAYTLQSRIFAIFRL